MKKDEVPLVKDEGNEEKDEPIFDEICDKGLETEIQTLVQKVLLSNKL